VSNQAPFPPKKWQAISWKGCNPAYALKERVLAHTRGGSQFMMSKPSIHYFSRARVAVGNISRPYGHIAYPIGVYIAWRSHISRTPWRAYLFHPFFYPACTRSRARARVAVGNISRPYGHIAYPIGVYIAWRSHISRTPWRAYLFHPFFYPAWAYMPNELMALPS